MIEISISILRPQILESIYIIASYNININNGRMLICLKINLLNANLPNLPHASINQELFLLHVYKVVISLWSYNKILWEAKTLSSSDSPLSPSPPCLSAPQSPHSPEWTVEVVLDLLFFFLQQKVAVSALAHFSCSSVVVGQSKLNIPLKTVVKKKGKLINT